METEDEAVHVSNDTVFGLVASGRTSFLRALRVVDRLGTGTVPGVGRDLSLHAFDRFSDLKTSWVKH